MSGKTDKPALPEDGHFKVIYPDTMINVPGRGKMTVGDLYKDLTGWDLMPHQTKADIETGLYVEEVQKKIREIEDCQTAKPVTGGTELDNGKSVRSAALVGNVSNHLDNPKGRIEIPITGNDRLYGVILAESKEVLLLEKRESDHSSTEESDNQTNLCQTCEGIYGTLPNLSKKQKAAIKEFRDTLLDDRLQHLAEDEAERAQKVLEQQGIEKAKEKLIKKGISEAMKEVHEALGILKDVEGLGQDAVSENDKDVFRSDIAESIMTKVDDKHLPEEIGTAERKEKHELLALLKKEKELRESDKSKEKEISENESLSDADKARLLGILRETHKEQLKREIISVTRVEKNQENTNATAVAHTPADTQKNGSNENLIKAKLLGDKQQN